MLPWILVVFALCFYIIVLPDYGWGKYYDFYKIFVSYQVVTGLIFTAALFWLARAALKTEKKSSLTAQDVAVLTFLMAVLLAGFVGFIRGNQSKYIYKPYVTQ